MSVVRENDQLIFVPFISDHVNALLDVAHEDPLSGSANVHYLIWNILQRRLKKIIIIIPQTFLKVYAKYRISNVRLKIIHQIFGQRL